MVLHIHQLDICIIAWSETRCVGGGIASNVPGVTGECLKHITNLVLKVCIIHSFLSGIPNLVSRQ